MCSFCRCNRADNPYTDFLPWAPWLHLQTTIEMAIANPLNHPIFRDARVHCHLFFVNLDIMHIVCLGVLLHMLANVIFEWVHDTGLAGSAEARSFQNMTK